ncbi:hypothetical protein [Heyndrickxia faecalis]|uniref:hypothetical protein n=1 Tax=Heyndrickxia faecalis TaxID=2824910 RepID=UPI0032B17497
MKSNDVDLTGRTFYDLTVKSRHTEKLYKETAWVCECVCGNITYATTGQLLHGRKKSCGCRRKRTPGNALDLTGKRFGKLTVIERSGTLENGRALWLCRCDCGNTIVTNATTLRRGEAKSCGKCLVDERIKHAREDLMNNKTVDGVPVPLLTKKVRSDSGTGHKGVHRRIRKGKEKFEVSITVKGKRMHIGTFNKLEDAINARKAAEKEYFEPYIKALEEKEREQK